MKEMNGVQPFVYVLTCGCVFTQAGLKTVSIAQAKEKDTETELEVCPQCAMKFSLADDIITINPSQEEEEVLRAKMERRRLLEPPKKSKKRKNAVSPDDPDPPTKKQAVQPSLNPSIAAASRAVVSGLAMEEAKRKAGMSDAVKSLYASSDGKKRKETFMTMGTFTRVRNFCFVNSARSTNGYQYSTHDEYDMVVLHYCIYVMYGMVDVNAPQAILHSWMVCSLAFHPWSHLFSLLTCRPWRSTARPSRTNECTCFFSTISFGRR
jgi:ribosome-binding protein aMBF1 (putative translation factor)